MLEPNRGPSDVAQSPSGRTGCLLGEGLDLIGATDAAPEPSVLNRSPLGTARSRSSHGRQFGVKLLMSTERLAWASAGRLVELSLVGGLLRLR